MKALLTAALLAGLSAQDVHEATRFEVVEHDDLRLARVGAIIGGVEKDISHYLDLDRGFEFENRRRFVWVDRDVDPGLFERSFEEVRGAVEVGPAESASAASRLEGEQVLFRRDEDDGWSASSPEDALDDKLLERLRPDLGFGLRPPRDVRAGTRWKVYDADLRPLLQPGGELALDFADEPVGKLLDVFTLLFLVNAAESAGTVEGTLVAECAAVEEGPAGGRLARVSLEGRVESRRELTERFREIGESAGAAEQWEKFFRKAELQADLRFEGTLVWDLGRDALQSLELEGASSFVLAIDLVGISRSDQESAYRAYFEGKRRLSVGAP